MANKLLILLIALILGATFTSVDSPDANPILTQRYAADPNPMVFDGRLYVYSSNDQNNRGGYDIVGRHDQQAGRYRRRALQRGRNHGDIDQRRRLDQTCRRRLWIGAQTFEARAAAGSGGGQIEIRVGSPTGRLIGTATVSGTGGWAEWQTIETKLSSIEGVHDLYFIFKGQGPDALFNFNWWRVKP